METITFSFWFQLTKFFINWYELLTMGKILNANSFLKEPNLILNWDAPQLCNSRRGVGEFTIPMTQQKFLLYDPYSNVHLLYMWNINT